MLVASLAVSALPTDREPPRPSSASRGLALLQHFNDSLPQYSGSALRCTSCHLDDGLRATAMSWAGVTTRYPRFRARRGSIETIEQRVNECITRSLSGRALPEHDPAMLDIVAYLDSLRDAPRPERPDTVRLTGDTIRGKALYRTQCVRCHGATGAGGSAPAIYGVRSYSIGAGMARQTVLATFIRWNMPYDLAGTLPAQDAADIAAWVLRRPRQDHPGKEADWPRGDAPADVAYATDAARQRGLPLPPPRPLLRRVIAPNLPAR